jgi:K+-transporting ATPase ATPase A chain
MTALSWLQVVLYLAVLILLALPLGHYMARVYEDRPTWLSRPLMPLERLIYRLARVQPDEEMDWKGYALAMLWFSVLSTAAVYVLQRVQFWLPLNPAGQAAVTPDSSFNTAVSFATNTNWQGYGGESTMSYLTQMAALTTQNFVSAAAGMAILVAFIRGLTRRQTTAIGNFWVDLTRTTVYILLPLAVVLSLLLVSQGVVQNFSAYVHAPLMEATAGSDNKPITEQVIAVGPAASQIAIKQLGTNGGGFFNVNSAHPLENPTPFSNLLEMLAILLIGAALCFTFGHMVKDRRQGWALLIAMFVLFLPPLLVGLGAEHAGNPRQAAMGVDIMPAASQPGGNMEGKEVRFGLPNSVVWSVATTAASNGSVNSMHDSFTPLGGMMPIWMMQVGEVVFGGVGSGLYGMLMFAVVAVFVSGLMVGRTPEYLGKKIEAYEMKMATMAVLVSGFSLLIDTAVAVVLKDGLSSLNNPGAHGFSEILYAFSSASNNNGSAFAGLNANTPFYNTALGIAMWFGRFWIAVPVLAVAGSLAKKKIVPASPGTLPTHTPLFVGLLVGVVILVGALSFFPALALGPIVEHLQLMR